MKDFDFTASYLAWLKENIEECRIDDSTYRITIPFLDRNNDHLDLFIIQDGENYKITDDSYIISDLAMSGLDIFGNERRSKVLRAITHSFGVSVKDEELFIEATASNLPQKKHMLAQCMLKVSDMFYLSRSNVQSIFLDDVKNFLDSKDVRYVADVSFTGQSQLLSQYDFAIPHSSKAPERLIKVVNRFDVNAAKNVIFAWNDTKTERLPDTQLFTFIRDYNDNENLNISSDALLALKQYGIKAALWSEREAIVKDLVA